MLIKSDIVLKIRSKVTVQKFWLDKRKFWSRGIAVNFLNSTNVNLRRLDNKLKSLKCYLPQRLHRFHPPRHLQHHHHLLHLYHCYYQCLVKQFSVNTCENVKSRGEWVTRAVVVVAVVQVRYQKREGSAPKQVIWKEPREQWQYQQENQDFWI